MLNQIAINGPSRISELGLLPWQDLPPTERLLALRLLLWGKRADSLEENTLSKLAEARDQVQGFNSMEKIICGYLLSAIVGSSEEHNSRVEAFILMHLGNEYVVGSALMSLEKAVQPLECYSAVLLTEQAYQYEFFRAVLSFRLSQPEYSQRALGLLFGLAESTYLKMAVEHVSDITILLEALCNDICSQSELVKTQQLVFNEVFVKYTQFLETLLSSEIPHYIPPSLIETVRKPKQVPLNLITPLVLLLLDSGYSQHPLVSVVAEKLVQSEEYKMENIKLMSQIAKSNIKYRSMACLMFNSSLAQPIDDSTHWEILGYLREFDPVFAQSVHSTIKNAIAGLALNRLLEQYEIPAVEKPPNFADFVEKIAEMLRNHTLNELKSEVLQTSSSADYCQNLLKDAWKTKGYTNYIRLHQLATPEAERAINYYAELFSLLQHSMLIAILSDSNFHPVVHYYAGSDLLLLFQLKLPVVVTQPPSLSPTDPPATLLLLWEKDLRQLLKPPRDFKPISEEHLAWLEPILNSQLVIDTYRELGVRHQTILTIKGSTYFASLPQLHGVTLFHGIILTKKEYHGPEDKQKCGLLITLFHEFAHYCRRMEEGFYDPTRLTPTRNDADSETYLAGTPGDMSNHQVKPSSIELQHGEGGYQAEELLFGLFPTCITVSQARFLLKRESWVLKKSHFIKQLGDLYKVGPRIFYLYARNFSSYDYSRPDLLYDD